MKPIKVVKEPKYPKMYRLEWEDGVQSSDFYNLTRAKDILQNYDLYRANMQSAVRMSNRMPCQSTEKLLDALE